VPGDLDLGRAPGGKAREALELGCLLRTLLRTLLQAQDQSQRDHRFFSSAFLVVAPACAVSTDTAISIASGPCTSQVYSLRPPLPGRSLRSSCTSPPRRLPASGRSSFPLAGRVVSVRRAERDKSGRYESFSRAAFTRHTPSPSLSRVHSAIVT